MSGMIRILSVGNFTTGWDGSICDEEHIAGALEELGHEVTRWQRGEIGQFNAPYDFALIAQWDGYGPKLFEMLREMTNKIVYWAFDYQADGQEWHERLVREADLYLSKRIADSKYPNWQWLSQDFAPDFLDMVPYTEKDIDVLFTGSYLPWAEERNQTLKAVDDNFNLVIHSVTSDQWKAQGFKNVYGPVMDDGLPELIARSKINLSIDHTLEAGYWSDRNAQILCCNGVVLYRYVGLSEVAFKDYVTYFYSVDDCLEKLQQLLVSNIWRPRNGSRSYQYAQQHLKVKNRVQDLLTIVGVYI